jgi:transposase
MAWPVRAARCVRRRQPIRASSRCVRLSSMPRSRPDESSKPPQSGSERYALRAGVEGTLSQGIRAFGLRQARYLGQAKTHLQHVITATAINVVRLLAWITETPRCTTRISRFAALAP